MRLGRDSRGVRDIPLVLEVEAHELLQVGLAQEPDNPNGTTSRPRAQAVPWHADKEHGDLDVAGHVLH